MASPEGGIADNIVSVLDGDLALQRSYSLTPA